MLLFSKIAVQFYLVSRGHIRPGREARSHSSPWLCTWKVEWKKYSKKSIKDVEVGLEQPLKPEIQHHIHNKVLNKWVKTEDLNNPEVKFKVSLDEQACETFGINIKVKTTKKSNKRTNRKNKDHIGMADSGAACCMGDPGFLKSVGLSIKDLPPVRNSA